MGFPNMGLPNMGLPHMGRPSELPVTSFPKKKACVPSIQMRQLHWGKLPDAKIKGTIWEKEITDEHVKVQAHLISFDLTSLQSPCNLL